MDLNGYLEKTREEILGLLKERVPSAGTVPESLHQAMNHALYAGGKRLRPLLVLEACQLAGGKRSPAYDAAAAIECLHTFTLIHDDLPCMDDDDTRRGVPTCHVLYGEDIALLAGDALMFTGMELLTRPDPQLMPAVQLENALAVARALGSRGVIAGQVLDLESEGREPDPQRLREIHRHKTGALLEVSLEIGARAGGAATFLLERLKAYGRHFGLAFQITDDILDVTGDAARMGKATGRDAGLHKMTYPALYGLEESRQLARQEIRLALEALEGLQGDNLWVLRALVESLLERTF